MVFYIQMTEIFNQKVAVKIFLLIEKIDIILYKIICINRRFQ